MLVRGVRPPANRAVAGGSGVSRPYASISSFSGIRLPSTPRDGAREGEGGPASREVRRGVYAGPWWALMDGVEQARVLAHTAWDVGAVGDVADVGHVAESAADAAAAGAVEGDAAVQAFSSSVSVCGDGRCEASGGSAAVFATVCDGDDFSDLAFDWPGFEPAVGSGGEAELDDELSFSPSELHALTALGVVDVETRESTIREL